MLDLDKFEEVLEKMSELPEEQLEHLLNMEKRNDASVALALHITSL